MKAKNLFIHILAVLISLPLIGTVAQAATIEVLETFDYPGTGNQPFRRRLTKKATSLAFSSIRTGCPGVLSGSAMAALARRSSTLTIPWVLPKDEASITEHSRRRLRYQRWHRSLVFPVGRHLHGIRCSRRDLDQSALDKQCRRLYRQCLILTAAGSSRHSSALAEP